MSDSPQDSEWSDYRRLVIHELERLATSIQELEAQNRVDHLRVLGELTQVKQEISALKIKASFYGAVSGLGAGLSIFFAQIFGRGFH